MFRVIPPSGRVDSADNLDPNLYEYEVIDEEKKRRIVGADKISRAKGVLSKDKIKLFLKQHLTSTKRSERMTVKISSRNKFVLDQISWTQLFAGPLPVFGNDLNESSEPTASTSDNSAKKSNQANKKSLKNSDMSSEVKTSKISKKTKKMEEKERLRKEEEEKLKEKERQEEWNKKRDDLACDDLQLLPEPMPIKCRISSDLFSDSMLVLEFFHSFNDLFDIETIFPMGITLELMEIILFDYDIDGPFVDLIKVLLTSNFAFLEEQDNSEAYDQHSDITSEDEERHLRDEEVKDLPNNGERTSKFYYQWVQSQLGSKLSNINLDAFTITEILRLYLLSSGGAPEDKTRRSYKPREDPAIEFVAENETILSKLESQSIFSLTPEERLKTFHVLIHQLLSFFEFREKIDDSFEEMTKLRKKIRDIQMEFNKWTKDNKPLTKKELQNESQKSSHSTTEERNVYRQEKSHKEEEKFRLCGDIRSQIRKLQACYALKPIGVDRAFRVYWLFESLPGLFVEHVNPKTDYSSLPFGPCLSEPTPKASLKKLNVINKKDTQRDDSSTTSDKENETISEETGYNEILKTCRLRPMSAFDKCTANLNTCAVHGVGCVDRSPEWAFYYTEEQLNCLIHALNTRGHRESSLRFALNRDKNIVIDYLNRCQPHKLNTDLPQPEISRRSQRLQEVFHIRKRKISVTQDLNEAFITNLKEYLLSLEEKLFAASLLMNVSRDEWRSSVDSISFEKSQCIDKVTKIMVNLKARVRPMCLSSTLLEDNWSQGLAHVTSISQLFVYLSVLDDNIKWSKSAREAYCKICRRQRDAQNMLLCDQCNRGHHIYCLQPSLDAIPNGEWFCPECCPKFRPQSPKKKKTKVYSESDYDSSDGDQSDSDEDSGSITNNTSTTDLVKEKCANCAKSVTSSQEQLSCAKCLNFYHLECTNLKRITRSDWFCNQCLSRNSRRKRKFVEETSLSEDSEADDSLVSDRRLRSKRFRCSEDSDYVSDKSVKEINEKMTITTSSRRRLGRQSPAFRHSMPLDFGLCEEILNKLKKHPDCWLFRNKPNQVMTACDATNDQSISHFSDFRQRITAKW